uniref:Factor H binding protein-like C-terminal domain-containing protein n=1 Tax=Psychrobacter sp. (strain PRwf-1) TaxID=349106 RepID=A5WCH9_PSYWF
MSLVNLSKLSFVVVLGLGVVACSSGGSSSSFGGSSPIITPEQQAQKIEANRVALVAKAKKAGLTEVQANAYAEANKEASVNDAESALNKILADIEAERLEKIEANRVALVAKAKKAGLTEAQANAYAQANKEVSTKDAESALNKILADIEAERLEKIEANRVALVAKAKKAGLTEAQANAYAQTNKEVSTKDAESALNKILADIEAERLEKIEANRVALVAKAKKAGLTEAQANAYAQANKEVSTKDAESALSKILADIAEAQRLEKIEANRVALVAKAKKAGLTEAQANAYAQANKEGNTKDAESALNKILADIAEAQRLEKIEANRVALVAKAKKAGLTEAQANAYAQANKEANTKDAESALNKILADITEAQRLEKIEANRVALVAKAKKAGLTEAQANAYAQANKEANTKDAESALNKILADIEAERLEKIEANRVALIAKAKKAGLTDAQANAYAQANKEASTKDADSALNKILADIAETKRLEKIEANRVALVAKAKKAGLTDAQAESYAEANKEASAKDADTALNNILAEIKEHERLALEAAVSLEKGHYDNPARYPEYLVTAHQLSYSDSTLNNDRTINIEHEVVYNQPYSVVIGSYSSWTKGIGSYIFSSGMDSSFTTKGLKTKADAIPSLGKANYSGLAFSSEENPIFASTSGYYKEGLLSYDVDFGSRKGSGTITGLGDVVELHEGTISGSGISSLATQSYKTGDYSLGFYGKKAEEIVGTIAFEGKDTIGFGGTRGEITK